MTGGRIDPRLIQLVPPLSALAIPPLVIDKMHYSPFKEPAFLRVMARLEALVIAGGETDVCVLAAVMDAVDAVIAPCSPLCSVSENRTTPMLRQFTSRFSQQIEVAGTEARFSGTIFRTGRVLTPSMPVSRFHLARRSPTEGVRRGSWAAVIRSGFEANIQESHPLLQRSVTQRRGSRAQIE